jgi:hypothetical protein
MRLTVGWATAWLAQTTVEIRQGIHCPAHRSSTVLEAGEQLRALV